MWKCRVSVWWVWSIPFLCNGGFNIALINLKIGLVKQPTPDANSFSWPISIRTTLGLEFDGFSEFFWHSVCVFSNLYCDALSHVSCVCLSVRSNNTVIIMDYKYMMCMYVMLWDYVWGFGFNWLDFLKFLYYKYFRTKAARVRTLEIRKYTVFEIKRMQKCTFLFVGDVCRQNMNYLAENFQGVDMTKSVSFRVYLIWTVLFSNI